MKYACVNQVFAYRDGCVDLERRLPDPDFRFVVELCSSAHPVVGVGLDEVVLDDDSVPLDHDRLVSVVSATTAIADDTEIDYRSIVLKTKQKYNHVNGYIFKIFLYGHIVFALTS